MRSRSLSDNLREEVVAAGKKPIWTRSWPLTLDRDLEERSVCQMGCNAGTSVGPGSKLVS